MKEDKGFIDKWNIIEYMEDKNWVGNLEDYSIGGVWALFGKKKEETNKNDEWFCLQVAKTRDIEDEISEDMTYLKIKKHNEGEKNYVNQFGEKMFDYTAREIVNSNIREVEYSDIMSKYKNLLFICVCEESDKTKRTAIERYFAWNAHALYWRNGRPYKGAKYYPEKKLNEARIGINKKIGLNDDIKKDIDSFWNSPTINNKFINTVEICNTDCSGK